MTDQTTTTKQVEDFVKSGGKIKKIPTGQTAKKAATKKVVTRPAMYDDGSKITVLLKEWVKREGTSRHEAFKLASKAKTYGAYLKAGGNKSLFQWCVRKKFIKVS